MMSHIIQIRLTTVLLSVVPKIMVLKTSNYDNKSNYIFSNICIIKIVITDLNTYHLIEIYLHITLNHTVLKKKY